MPLNSPLFCISPSLPGIPPRILDCPSGQSFAEVLVRYPLHALSQHPRLTCTPEATVTFLPRYLCSFVRGREEKREEEKRVRRRRGWEWGKKLGMGAVEIGGQRRGKRPQKVLVSQGGPASLLCFNVSDNLKNGPVGSCNTYQNLDSRYSSQRL